MDRIEVDAPAGSRRNRFFARAVGTRFSAVAPTDNVTQIDLYDEIGFWGVTAKDFRAKLRDAGDIVLRINSPGGDVFDGIAIYNDLKEHKGSVRVEITGIAASMASVIAMAGSERAIADNAFMMIHNAWTIAIGNRNELADLVERLGKIDDALARTYAGQSGTGIRSIKQMMDDETWLTGKEAKDAGFATEILKPADLKAQAKFDLSVFEHVPKSLMWGDDVFDKPESEEDVEKLLMRDAGRTRTQARSLIREIRAGKTSVSEAMPGAGEVRLDGLLDALKALKA